MIKRLKNNKLFFVMMAFIIVFTPISLTMESQSTTRAIVTAIGIDKINDEYSVSTQVVIPKQTDTFNETLQVVTSSGINVSQALKKITLHIGKKLGFGHCNIIIINDEIAKENIIDVLDYFVRENALSNTSIMINTDESSKNLLKSDVKIDENFSFSLNNIVTFNHKFLSCIDTNLEDILTGYMSPSKSSVMTYITTMNNSANDSSGQSSNTSSSSSGTQSSSSNGGASSSSTSSNNDIILNDGESSLFKYGKKIANLSSIFMRYLSYFTPDSKAGQMEVKNVNTTSLKDASITLDTLIKNMKVKTYFENNRPFYDINLDMEVIIDQIHTNEENKNFDVYGSYKSFIDDELLLLIKKQVESEMYNTISTLKGYDTDIIRTYELFIKNNSKQYLDFVKIYGEENFFKLVNFKCNANIKAQVE
jgi:Ger(x)C family germination protein